eukprot:s2658_g6.t1
MSRSKLLKDSDKTQRPHETWAHGSLASQVNSVDVDCYDDVQIAAVTLDVPKELVKSIEDLREKREELNRQILKEEEDKAKIQKELSILTDRLQKINESLVRKTQARNEYDKTIQETEAAYMKILESSQTLLHVLKRETVNLTKKKGEQ